MVAIAVVFVSRQGRVLPESEGLVEGLQLVAVVFVSRQEHYLQKRVQLVLVGQMGEQMLVGVASMMVWEMLWTGLVESG